MPRISILVDTNVFISAFKTGETKSTELFIKLIRDEDIQLVSNDILLKEYEKYAKKLGPNSVLFFKIMKEKCKDVEPDEEHIQRCKQYFESSYADMIHAATCLKSEATILTNDKHFYEIGKSELIEVWDISYAITHILE